jgi:glycosyltransferase involved in cell wall biosynthesis
MFMLRMRMLFERLRRRIPFDIIHQMNPVFTGLSLSLIGVRTPLVLGTFVPRWESEFDPHSRPSPWRTSVRDILRRHVTRLQQAQASALLLASPRAVSRILQPDRHAGRIYEVPHGIDVTSFAERPDVPARSSVLFLANVIYRKGVFTLLSAFQQVATVCPEAELVIAGGGDDLAEVRRRVAGIPGCRIRVLGPIERSRIHDVMRQHSVYCLPSYGEPFATSILEAMACGVPVVATRSGAIPDLVTDAGGRLVAPRDVAALAAALVEILTSPALQRQMGKHNRVRAETEFEAEKAADRLEDAYHAVLRRATTDNDGPRAGHAVRRDTSSTGGHAGLGAETRSAQ